jgi:hypothetical protein
VCNRELKGFYDLGLGGFERKTFKIQTQCN